jgi:hypothetical protein
MSYTKRYLESIGFFEEENSNQFWDEYFQYEEYLLTQKKEEQACLDNIEVQSL